MQRLSSSYTILYKRLFPALCYGLPVLWLALFFWTTEPGQRQESGKIAAVIAFVILTNGLYMVRRFAAEPVEEVWMEEDSLLIRHKGKEERIPMTAITKMIPSRFMNPKRLTVELVQPSAFGKQIIFLLPGQKERPVLEEFIRRLNFAHQSPPPVVEQAPVG